MAKQLERASGLRPTRKKSLAFRIIRWVLLTFAGLVTLIILLSVFLVLWLVMRPLPQTDGTVQIPGLTAEVKVVRDKSGVPHITAANTADLFMAQGYVTAQDRLWQMDFYRRIGAGRLSEVLGNDALGQDVFLRTIGLRRAASAELDSIPADGKLILESYAKGVSAFIDSHKDNLPIEFTLLGYSPEPWTVLDTLTWGKVMAYDLGGNYDREILRASLIDKLGAAQAAQLLPLTGAEGTPLIVPSGVSYQNMEQNMALVDIQSKISALVGSELSGKGSNNWVVSGAKTTTGKPMLANDPHLGIRNPSIWYEVHLKAPGWNVAGVTFPGIPGVVIGHNERIAWGVTNVGGDTQDFYLEKINPANPKQYEYQGTWQDLQIVREEIKIAGKPSKNLDVRITRHGPIMNDAIDSINKSQPLALKWVALGNSPLVNAVLNYDRATNWQTFRTALKDFNIAGQNFVFADVDGNIGYQLTGLWPTRAKGDGLMPVPGWTGEYEWTGVIPFDSLPSVYNPPTNFIATANQRPAPFEKFPGGQEFDPGWRAQRITQLLQAKEKLSLEDLGAIQRDVMSIPGKEIASYLGKLPETDPKLSSAIKRLREWDGRLTADSVPGALYKVTYTYMLENMFKAKLGDVYEDYIGDGAAHLPTVFSLLKDAQNPWWGTGGRDALLQKSLGQAIDYLNGKFGGNSDDWKWGKLHTVSFAQTPIGNALPFPLSALINLKTVEQAGDSSTVAAASYRYDKPYNQTSGVSFRGLMNLANFDDSLITNTTGQSGQPFGKHYGDNIDDWITGRYHPFLFSAAAIDKLKDTTLTLQPK